MREHAMSEEIIAADISFKKNAGIENLQEINGKLSQIEQQIEENICEASKLDYALSIASGIMAGAIDSLYVGEIKIGKNDIALSHEQVNHFIQDYAKSRGHDKARLKDSIKELEEAFPVLQDNVWSGKGIKISAKNHHLADIAHHPTPMGLAAAIIVQFLRVGTFVNKEGEWHFILVPTEKKDLIEVYAPVVISGLLNWLLYIAETKYEEREGEHIPEAVKKLAHILASTPLIIEILQVADNWFGHLVSDMGGSRSTAGGGMGIPGIFISLLYEIASLPILKNTELPMIVNRLYEKEKVNLRRELPVYKAIGLQAVPVIFNELCVRTIFFISRLANELRRHKDIKKIDWNNIVPFSNRTVDRMLMVSSVTFSVADTADAAVRAAIESGGNWAVFGGKFASRVNYVGAGRAAISVVKEISNEAKEAQLIHERRLLTEQKADIVIPVIQKYKNELTQMISNYLAEDIEAYMNGLMEINKGLECGNADSVIYGSVIIQRRLGKEIQFTNQEEFDDLMDSDIALQF